MRFIVTGGSGFVGKALINRLSSLYPDIEIHNIDITSNDSDISNLKNHSIDIRNLDSLMSFRLDKDDVVYHLAANIFNEMIPYRTKRASWFKELNIGGTKNILAAMEKMNAKRIAFVSTDMVYGTPETNPVLVSHALNPNGPYGESKVEAERLVWQFSNNSDNKSIIFRPRVIVGPGRFGLLNKLFYLIKRNLPIPLIGSGKNRYQFISVYDCVEALVQFHQLKYPTGLYNLGSIDPPTIYELLTSLIEKSNSKSFLVPTQGYVVKQILNVLDIVNLSLLYPEQFMLADHDFVLDISTLEKDLNFKPKFNDEDMLYKAYESYLEKF